MSRRLQGAAGVVELYEPLQRRVLLTPDALQTRSSDHPDSLVSTWSRTSYNGTQPPPYRSPICAKRRAAFNGQTKCFSKPQILLVAYRPAEVNNPGFWYGPDNSPAPVDRVMRLDLTRERLLPGR